MAEPVEDEISRYTRRLTPRGKQVINLAQTYSERLRVIHMEHLVFALVDLNTTITTRILGRLKISRKRLEAELSKFDVPQKLLEPKPSRPPVRFSRHALEALRGADEFRIKRDGKSIRSRDLLVGVLSVSDCTVVQRLQELKITRETVETAIGDDDVRRGKSGEKKELSQPASQTGDVLPPANVRRIHTVLLEGNEDERQAVIAEIAEGLGAFDYSELRLRLITDLTSRFQPLREPQVDNIAPIRSWMASTLGLISPFGDVEVMGILRTFINPEVEPYESVRFWSVAAFWRVTHEFPAEVKFNDPGSSVVALAEAFRAKLDGQGPKRFAQALQEGSLSAVWGILRALRIVAFPGLVPLLCNLLQRQKRETGNVFPYEILQALSNSEIVELSSRELITTLGPEEVANHVVYALLDSSH